MKNVQEAELNPYVFDVDLFLVKNFCTQVKKLSEQMKFHDNSILFCAIHVCCSLETYIQREKSFQHSVYVVTMFFKCFVQNNDIIDVNY